jgi:NTE family protein
LFLFRRKKIGLALGGGGIRAMSSIGVLRRFEKAGIGVKYIAGTSMGAVVGALYSHYQDADLVEKKVREVQDSKQFKKLSDEFNLKLSSVKDEWDSRKRKLQSSLNRVYILKKLFSYRSIVTVKNIQPVINLLLPDISIEELPVKFCCISTDLIEGKKIITKEGSLRTAVMGSIAVPGIIEPVARSGMLLSDGGAVSLTPAEEVALLGASFIIAVETEGSIRRKENFRAGIEIIERTHKIATIELHRRILKKADVIISPAVKNIHWANFKKIDYCIAAGEGAALYIEEKI